MIEIKLPSGAILKVTVAPFADAKALYQAVLEELKSMKLNSDDDIGPMLYKDLFCTGFSSRKIESALDKCMTRATYNGLKIDGNTFEPIEARDDYFKVCYEVGKANISPFVKSLCAEYSHLWGALKADPASRLQKTT